MILTLYNYHFLTYRTIPGFLQSRLDVGHMVSGNGGYNINLSISFYWVNQRFIVQQDDKLLTIRFNRDFYMSQKEIRGLLSPNLDQIPPNPASDIGQYCL